MHALSLGRPSVESAAYLIKSRVKRVDSLVLKVNDRQKKDALYSPRKARDIVGLRLLTLFRNELPLLVRRFLDFVVRSQKDGLDLFQGSSLRESVAEIKMYGLDRKSDPNMDLCIREFMEFGFELSDSQDQQEDEPAKIVVDQKASQYSSIHVVFWAKGPSGHISDRVPIEVQFRTSLEDVWGEIDHRAIYKKKLSQKRRSAHRDVNDAGLKRRIGVLKGFLDSCSAAADDIELDLIDDEIEDVVTSFKSYSSIDLTEIRYSILPDNVQGSCAEAIKLLRTFYKKVKGHKAGESVSSISDWFTILGGGTALLQDTLKNLKIAGDDREEDLIYRLRMELALSYYWQAILLKEYDKPIRNAAGIVDSWHQAIRKSVSEYMGLVGQERYQRRSSLFFRLGNAISFQGRSALTYYKMSYDLLKTDSHISADNYLRMRIPRQYGLALWFEGSRLEQEAVSLGFRMIHAESERQFYFDAIRITRPVHGMHFSSLEPDASFGTSAEESRITANNILDYVVCFAEVGGSLSELSGLEIDDAVVQNFIAEVSGGQIDNIRPITLADTVRKAYLFIGDLHSAKLAALRVKSLEGTWDITVPLTEFHYKKMLSEAGDTINM